MKTIFFLLYLFPVTALIAQYDALSGYPYFHPATLGSRSADLFSWRGNVAALARSPSAGTGIGAEKKYGMKEGQRTMLTATFPLRRAGIALAVTYAGTWQFNTTHIVTGLARQLGRIDLGIQFSWTAFNTIGYSTVGSPGAGAGILWHISNRLHAGLQIDYPNVLKTNTAASFSELVFSPQLNYELSDQASVAVIFIKEENTPPSVQAGIHYEFTERFFARAAIHTATASPQLGIGWQNGQWRILVSGSMHAYLGISPLISFQFQPVLKKII